MTGIPGERNIDFLVGTCREEESGRTLVLIDFRQTFVDHLKLTPEKAAEFAQAVAETAVDAAKNGRLIITGGHQSPDKIR